MLPLYIHLDQFVTAGNIYVDNVSNEITLPKLYLQVFSACGYVIATYFSRRRLKAASFRSVEVDRN